ncbi:MAG: ornithine cyclodeaminase family protein [FCB group bacterium]|jgi:ornithine cyclodeaminase/alanine dehydrogenase
MAILLSKSDVIKILDMKTTMDVVEKAFAELYEGSANMPQRTPIAVPEHEGVALFMPAFMKKLGAIGAKIVTVYKNNVPKYNMPTVLGTILILDEKTGNCEAIMDGGFITAMRTGSVSGIATKYMANKDAKFATILGSGIQAKTQVWATCEAHKFEKYYVYSVDPPESIDAFCKEMEAKHEIHFEKAKSAEFAVRQADVLTLATSSKDPIINGDWLKPGCHINGIGSHAVTMRELDTKTVVKARIIADLTDACMAEAGDFLIPMKEGVWDKSMIAGDLGAVITGKVAGRTSHDEITLFKSVGLAIQDISTAFGVYQLAKEKGIGTEFKFNV